MEKDRKEQEIWINFILLIIFVYILINI